MINHKDIAERAITRPEVYVKVLVDEIDRLREELDNALANVHMYKTMMHDYEAELDALKLHNALLEQELSSQRVMTKAMSDLSVRLEGERDHAVRRALLADTSAPADVMRDAERYQWLREQHWSSAHLCCVARPRESVRLGHDCPSGTRLDEAIDAAMLAAEQAQEGGK